MRRTGSAMKVTTVRFGTDLWRLLEAEATLAGVSVSQYIREAALARAAGAAAARGEDPLALLATGPRTPAPSAPDQPRADRDTAATLGRKLAETLNEHRATAAEAEQVLRRSRELRKHSGVRGAKEQHGGPQTSDRTSPGPPP